MMAVSNGARRSFGTAMSQRLAASSSSIALRVSSTVPRMSVFRSSLSPALSIYRTHPLVEFAKENIRYRFPGWGIGPDASLRQAKACRLKGMGLQEVPEHEAPLRAGKGKRTKTGTGKERKERKCSLNLMLEQTIFAKNP